MFCGTGNFSHVDDEPAPAPAPSTAMTSGGNKKHDSKNPYSARGLDKFSKVVSELEAKRERIMARAKAVSSTTGGGTPMVRFMYNSTKDWVPIIIRLQEDALPAKKEETKKHKKPLQLPAPPVKAEAEPAAAPAVAAAPAKEEGVVQRWMRWRPGYYWPLAMLVILLCLVFGRVFAICCTSVWWYLVPVMKGEKGSWVWRGPMMKRREHGGGHAKKLRVS